MLTLTDNTFLTLIVLAPLVFIFVLATVAIEDAVRRK